MVRGHQVAYVISYVIAAVFLLGGTSGSYVNEWAVHIPYDLETVKDVAREFGFNYHGKIGGLQNHYTFKKPEHLFQKRNFHHNMQDHTMLLVKDNRVLWAEQQQTLSRSKRDNFDDSAVKHPQFRDNLWRNEWYLHGQKARYENNNEDHNDLNVVPVWRRNITGKGVVVAVLDDGIEHNHTDLAANYEPRASHDFNDDDADPFPRYDMFQQNKHGTRCAGEIAMVANNDKCGVGVAYDASIGGIRMLDGKVTDSLEARALTFNTQFIDIMSSSWGPNDDGRTVEGPGRLATAALELGATTGRAGKGVIYVWASGNGGARGDNCDCDGYTGSIYTLSISSVSQQGRSPWYSELCASTMAATYSSGTFKDMKVTTTDLHNSCTTTHTGTSASAPLAAGIFALVLQTNPRVTWRDMQHLVACTSRPEPLAQNPGWRQNGAGFWVNSRFGFGLLDARGLVEAADPQVFRHAPEKAVCDVSTENTADGFPRNFIDGEELVISFFTSACRYQDNEIKQLEHVQLQLDLDISNRGQLEVTLQSPLGTRTMMLSKRPHDNSTTGFRDWPLMSVHNWGEDPAGEWIVRIKADSQLSNEGTLNKVKLILHGTKEEHDICRRRT